MVQALSAAQVGQRILALSEAPLRRAWLRDLILRLSPEEAAALIGALCRQAPKSARGELAALTLSQVLTTDGLDYDKQVEIYQAAKASGDDIASRFLLTSGRQPGSLRHEEGPGYEPSAPLGFRKTWARGHRREVLDRLLYDPDPQVLEILLQNPRVTEKDAVRVAARRPTSTAAQLAVFASRHGVSVEVRRALVFSPYSPADLSARLLPMLGTLELREVANSGELAQGLRAAARAILGTRIAA